MKSVLLGFLFLASGCGVKGKPLPLDTPPFIGRGYPVYEDRLETNADSANLRKKTLAPPEDDFKEPPDFDEEGP